MSPGAPVLIETQALSKSYRVYRREPGLWGAWKAVFRRDYLLKHALKGASLEVRAGEILGLVGANGAGKTTLVKILSGIVHPSGGQARVLGQTPWERSDRFRRGIALIMGQKAQLWWDLPAQDCFSLLQEIYQIEGARFRRNHDELTEALDVRDQLGIQIRRLSLGERMKMELIAALLHEPKVVFLDEPTIGLDLNAQKAIREFLLEYRRAHQPAMILTSHYMEDIESLCERIVIIREGEFVFDGPLERIQREHARYKILRARLSQADAFKNFSLNLPPEEAQILQVSEAGDVRLRVRRESLPELASRLLRELPIADLGIDEEDIGSIIASLIRAEAPVVAPREALSP